VETLHARGLVTMAGMFGRLTAHYAAAPSPFAFVVVDEAQDMGVAELRFLAALGRTRPDGLFFAGDLGQRIFRQPFSWVGLGVDIRGRSFALPINYRTSHQIRRLADRLLPAVLADADGFEEVRASTVSSFSGPPPQIIVAPDAEAEIVAVAGWLRGLAHDVSPQEIGVFVRSTAELPRARAALEAAGLAASELTDSVEPKPGAVSIGPMHLAKGLEFKAVAVMACDESVVPLQSRVEAVGATADLDDLYTTERHLLYVACTRAREHLLVSGVAPGSAYLEDLRE
jgi:superfamily I DNA/RNA helicase